ncbi:FAD-dependent monooxygenase [Streptantibioticus silvisoli]|uniref:FAD-dependent monooxygenase n=1 Tax=Streptantibioticus silvisoli TaxID=2705255 RepID=A0ABT6W9A1_9ACTN|nr:FAD-dependent monooxygenase [Streptantibioticus silvisoli]MDI5967335.1 FAD-dependent monooxygenase [Streptantibioticus silvisoli]
MTSPHGTAQVVVAGGGPVGLMAACELALGGVQAVVLERLAQPTGQSRALGLHSRTVEVFEQRGLLDKIEHQAPVWPKGHFAGLRKVDLTKLAGKHTYALMVPQSRTEELLAQRAVELGVEIRRGHEVTALEQHPDGVTVTVRTDDGHYRQPAHYLIGCDGGSSTVRKLTGVDFPGTASTVNAVLGDVQILGERPQARELLRLPGGLFGMIPLGGDRYRIVAVEFDAEPVARHIPLTVPELRETAHRVSGTWLEIGESYWLSRFGDASRQAAAYRVGRVLLAGDAAHIHFPAGGQGLNTGLQDALNLGWKLAATVRGTAPDGLLDTYHTERHPVGHRVCMNTRAQLSLMHPSERITPLRDMFSELLDLPQVNTYIAEMITGLDVRYPMPGIPRHPLVGARLPALLIHTPDGPVSTPQLLRQADALLLDLTDSGAPGDLAKPWHDSVRHIPARLDAQEETTGLAAALVRPDGYVAWATADATDTQGLTTALSTWFTPDATSIPDATSTDDVTSTDEQEGTR